MKTPKEEGFRMPAEWEPHEGTWLTWPKDPITWPDRVPQVEKVYLEMIRWLSTSEKVFLLVDDAATKQNVLERLSKTETHLENVIIHTIPTVDSWIRDYGPNFLVRDRGGKKELAFNHWIYNAWGGKYEELIADTEIPKAIAPLVRCPVFEPGIVLEGGSIEVNGKGVCLTTKQCLLNKNRNPHLNQKQIEKYLTDYLNVEKIVWLEEGIEGDDTDGHIDDISRFVNADTIVSIREEDRSSKNHEILETNWKILEKTEFNLVSLPCPKPIEGREGKPLPASYANFLISDKVVLAPVFNDKNDSKALSILEKLFAGKKVIGIPCQDLVWGLGAIHCVSQQQPKVS